MDAPHPLQEILAKTFEDARTKRSPILEAEGPLPSRPTVAIVRPKA